MPKPYDSDLSSLVVPFGVAVGRALGVARAV
jgi:hypothetical protein